VYYVKILTVQSGSLDFEKLFAERAVQMKEVSVLPFYYS